MSTCGESEALDLNASLVADALSGHKSLRSRRNSRHREVKRTQKQDAENARPFVVWDGESFQDAGYCLFGNSNGDAVFHHGLSTVEMLDLILETEREIPDAIHVGFRFDYDVNNILADLGVKGSWRYLAQLYHHHGVVWNGYTLEWIPGKWFSVARDGVRATVFDVFSFFHTSLTHALEDYDVGTPEDKAQIAEGKDKRSEFMWSDRDYVYKYWAVENRLAAEMMNQLRERFIAAGFFLKSWHGPGALARARLSLHKIYDVMADSPVNVWLAARYAYAGGRFQQFLAGFHDGPVWVADIRSAYPYACTMLPSLSNGHWIYKKDYRPTERFEFALFNITYGEFTSSPLPGPMPLFRRTHDNLMRWPEKVEGWYWGPEAWLVKDDSKAKFHGAWVFVHDGSKPFQWVQEDYDRRAKLKRMGNPAQLAFKLELNAISGQFAQRVGWDRDKKKPPRSHQLEYAGFITSVCRSMIQEVAKWCWDRDGLIAIETDGVFSRVPIDPDILPNGVGEALGQWDYKRMPGILYWQSGIYWARDEDGEWPNLNARSRGMPKGKVDIDKAWKALEDWQPIKFIQHNFVGIGLALQNRFGQWRTWRDEPRKIQFGGDFESKMMHGVREAGTRKRRPVVMMCRKCASGDDSLAGLHDLVPNPDFLSMDLTRPESFVRDVRSYPHFLPWLVDEPVPEFATVDLQWEEFDDE